MTTDFSSCDRRQVDAYLGRMTTPNEETALHAHLDDCAECRQYMENQAANTVAWKETPALLSPGEFDVSSAEEYCSVSTTISGRNGPTAQHVLRLLTPSEHNNSLGLLDDQYDVRSVIGAGGMGVVLEADDLSLSRTVAVKVLSPQLAVSPSAQRRFSREAKAVAAIRHPNVIAIHGVSKCDVGPYLVMPRIHGSSLQERIDAKGSLPLEDILKIAVQVSRGLAAAHACGLVHRDVKPANILLDQDEGKAILTDFGLARAVDDGSITRFGSVAGTPEYMSPEQARGTKIEQTSDLFSLGSVIYAMSTGRPPFRGENMLSILRSVSDESPTPIDVENPMIPAWLSFIVLRLMARSPSDRFGTATEVSTLLEACLEHVRQPDERELPDFLQTLTVRKAKRWYSQRQALIAFVIIAISFALLYFLS